MDWGNIGIFLIFGLIMFLMHRVGGGCCGGGGHHEQHCGSREKGGDSDQIINIQQVELIVEGMT